MVSGSCSSEHLASATLSTCVSPVVFLFPRLPASPRGMFLFLFFFVFVFFVFFSQFLPLLLVFFPELLSCCFAFFALVAVIF